jgi:YidC/Oxa1 family membrane protein insertase
VNGSGKEDKWLKEGKRRENMKDNKKFLIFLSLVVASFVFLCGVLVLQTGLFKSATPDKFILLQNTPANDELIDSTQNMPPPSGSIRDAEPNLPVRLNYNAVGGLAGTVIIGAADPNIEDPDTGFKLQLQLSGIGASIKKATFSNGNGKGFNDRSLKNPKSLVLLAPANAANGSTVYSMENRSFVLPEKGVQLQLDSYSWKPLGITSGSDGSQSAAFETEINYGDKDKIFIIRKTYTVYPKSYLIDCNLTVENVSNTQQEYRFNMTGPVGIDKEDKRADDRTSVLCLNDRGQFVTDWKKINSFGNETVFNPALKGSFLWCGIVNKYFAALLVPLPDQNKQVCDWINGKLDEKGSRETLTKEKTGFGYGVSKFFTGKTDYENSALDGKTTILYKPNLVQTANENIGINLDIDYYKLPSSEARTYKFQLYCGPKDKSVFDSDERYSQFGFVNSINMPCCCMFCPIMAVIRPLAFGIITLMGWMHYALPNYGVVIIILVFIVRLLMHPLTKKSQVSMSKMSKLAPMVEEIKKKYANDKVEMNKQMMALYRQQGASPVLGMLPMLIQMPIWVALYTAIDASISLRGAKFLPFWITDLSAPDSIITFPSINLILFSISAVNLLPILMGVAFYVQQKFTPQQTAAASNPQMESTQKMMMWMMPILFPIMLYSAPSGLNLYIMASTFAGVIEQYVIKKHIEERQKAEAIGLVPVTSKTGGKIKKKKPKPFYKKYI